VETKIAKSKNSNNTKSLPMVSNDYDDDGDAACSSSSSCSFFEGYDAASLMAETAKLRDLVTKRGTMEILIPLCCSTNPVRYKQFRQALNGVSSKTLAQRLKELEKAGILKRQSFNEIPPRVEYTLTAKGQELVESIISLLQWMRKWSALSSASSSS
jgi:DNA-binding HxlR family transcriptional regulator